MIVEKSPVVSEERVIVEKSPVVSEERVIVEREVYSSEPVQEIVRREDLGSRTPLGDLVFDTPHA